MPETSDYREIFISAPEPSAYSGHLEHNSYSQFHATDPTEVTHHLLVSDSDCLFLRQNSRTLIYLHVTINHLHVMFVIL